MASLISCSQCHIEAYTPALAVIHAKPENKNHFLLAFLSPCLDHHTNGDISAIQKPVTSNTYCTLQYNCHNFIKIEYFKPLFMKKLTIYLDSRITCTKLERYFIP